MILFRGPLLAFFGLLLMVQPVWAAGSEAILILANRNKAKSLEVAKHYSTLRKIPEDQILKLDCSDKEEILRADFDKTIATPVKEYLAEHPKVLIVVPCWGVPLKVKDRDPKDNAAIKAGFFKGRDNAAVDGEIALFRREGDELSGAIRNPIFGSQTPLTLESKILIVCRLDGPTPELAKELVDKAIIAEALGPVGQSFLDTRGPNLKGGYKVRDDIMVKVADAWKKIAFPFDHDVKPAVVDLSTREKLLHYYGWYAGSQKPKGTVQFRTGSIAIHLHSFSAATIRNPKRNWVAPLLQWGATATYGTVYEPLTVGFPYENVFWDRLAQGWSFGQAGQVANQLLSWQAVFVGDPLYTPYSEDSVKNHKAYKDAINNSLVADKPLDPALSKSLPLYDALYAILSNRLTEISIEKNPDEALKKLASFRFLIQDLGVDKLAAIARAPLAKGIKKRFDEIKKQVSKRMTDTIDLEQALKDWKDWDIYSDLEKFRDQVKSKQEKLSGKLLKKARASKSSKFYLTAWLHCHEIKQYRLSKDVALATDFQNEIFNNAKSKKRLMRDCQKKLLPLLKKAESAKRRKKVAKAQDILVDIVKRYPDCELKKKAAKMLKDLPEANRKK
ncbi:MAG: TIGR03790 family protein [Planctomycetota bacterium]|nr:TIGR03790 family protein [Planctomycetota bacterium]